MGLMKQQKEIFDYLKTQFGDDNIEFTQGDVGQPWFTFPVSKLKEIAKFLRDDTELRCNTLMCLSGAHYPNEGELGVTYHLHSTGLGHSIACKVRVPIENPLVPSVEAIWKTANWHEREAMDMVGVMFENHPNMTRILCPEDWEGYALRKDYMQQEFYQGVPTGA